MGGLCGKLDWPNGPEALGVSVRHVELATLGAPFAPLSTMQLQVLSLLSQIWPQWRRIIGKDRSACGLERRIRSSFATAEDNMA